MAGEGGTPKNPAHPDHPDHPQHPHHHAHIKTADSGAPVGQIVVVGLVIAVLGGAGLWYLNRKGEDNKLNTLFASQDTRKINTANGQRGDVTLSDGTKLSIGPDTKLVIIPNYNDRYRGIKVDGTVAFDVKASPNTPLEVRSGGASIVLNEGKFVVRGYDDEHEVTIKLTAGSAQVHGKEAHRDFTAPALLHVSADSTLTEGDSAKAAMATSWVDGKVTFKDTPLKDVLPLIDKYYALKIDTPDKALLDRPVTMEAALDSKKDAIAALEKAAYVKFGYDGSKPILKDDPAAAAKAAKAAKSPKK